MKSLIYPTPRRPPRFQVKNKIKLRFLLQKFSLSKRWSIFINIHSLLLSKWCLVCIRHWVRYNSTIMKTTDMHLCSLRTRYWGRGCGERGQLNQKLQYTMNYHDIVSIREAQIRGSQTQTWGTRYQRMFSKTNDVWVAAWMLSSQWLTK